MFGPEDASHPETSEIGEKFADGFTKYHFDPTALPELGESTLTQRDEGECTVDRGALDVEVWDKFIREKVGEKEGLRERKTAWVLDYLAEDEHPIHRDHLAPRRIKTVIVSVEGNAALFAESGPEPVAPGDVVVVDGRVNPEHSVKALTDRRAVVATYKY